jgi:SAM-dependent methyltransferase
MGAAMLHVNRAFCLDVAAKTRGRILDYGCGAGETVAAGLADSLDIYGCEVFYEGGGDTRKRASATGLIAGGRIMEMIDGHIPFPGAHFDFVFHNQVFEHVRDLDGSLSEIRRVLRQGGSMLSLFPTVEVLCEKHCGIPLAHRFSGGARRRYLLACRRLGLGYLHDGKSAEKWASDFDEFLNQSCVYRPLNEVMQAYRRAGFTFEPSEPAYAEFRLRRGYGVLALVPRIVPRLCSFAMRRLGGLVILSRKES